ncbi:MAG TPA: ABC transporter ATP-binding protein, partial [Rhodobiaceae bacterium]|nr:ABC transporter ATP-binding protein [Rhodobiaceae bacterium]
PNGSGKTTLFGSITGTHAVDSGDILFEGRSIAHLRPAPIARAGLLRTWQQTRIYGEMSCAENMAISAREAHGHVFSLLRPVPAATRRRGDDLL